MPFRPRLFILLSILLFILHVLITTYFVTRLTAVLGIESSLESRFAPSFGVAVTTFPLYSMLSGKQPLYRICAINSALFAMVFAFLFVRLRWRGIVAAVIGVPLLLLIAMTATSMLLEHRIEQGWRELAPHQITPAAPGDLNSPLGTESSGAVNAYLAREVARGDDRIAPPAQEVIWFLIGHRSKIDALRQHRPVTFKESQFLGEEKVLLVDALVTGSREDLDASIRRSDLWLHQPRFIPALNAISENECQLGVARKLGPPLHAALPSFDPHQQLIDELAATGAQLMKISVPWYARPYARLSVAESAESVVRAAKMIRTYDRCRFDLPPMTDSDPRVPFNPTGVADKNVGGRWAVRANRLLLDREATALILAIKSGAPPPSAVSCANHKWLLDGNVLRLDPTVPPAILPTRHQFSALPAGRTSP